MVAHRLSKYSSLFPLLFPLLFSYIEVVSSDNTHYIGNANEFINFANNVNDGTSFSGTTVYLTNDIDSNSYSIAFEPAGKANSDYCFSGIFDGQGHTIKNLAVNSSDFKYTALFGYSKGMTIKNVVIDKTCSFSNTYYSNDGSANNDAYVSSVIGHCEVGTCSIENVVNVADISYRGSKSMSYIISGGVIAKCKSNCVLRNCVNFGSVTISPTNTASYIHVGGIIAEVDETNTIATVRNCINYGTITNSIQGSSVYMGGIAGIIHSNTVIDKCLSAGPLSSVGATRNNYVGSVVGNIKSSYSENNTITNCFWTESVGNYNVSGKATVSSTALTITGIASIGMDEPSLDTLYSTMDPDDSHGWAIVHLNGGRIGNSSYDNLIVNKVVKRIPKPAREGSTFKFWCTDTGCSATCDSDAIDKCDSKELYAVWDRVNVVFLTFDDNNSTISRTLSFGDVIEYPEGVKKTGHTLSGWDNTTATAPGYDIVVSAIWSINNYTVTFDFDNGTEAEERSFVFNTEVIYPDDPIKEGYSFINWNDTSITTIPAYNLTIKALWVANNYTVTFNTTGGTAPPPPKREVTYGEHYGELPETTRTGYTLAGWFTGEDGNGESIDFDTDVAIPNNHTLYAYWVINNYTVTFDFDNGTEPEVRAFEYGAIISYPNNTTKDRHMFFGWDNNITVMPAHNLTIKAKWVDATSPSSTISITFSTVDLTDDTIKEFIVKYTDSGFNITSITKVNEDETIVIVKFNDVDEARSFVETISASNDKDNYNVKTVGFIETPVTSFSFYSIPMLLLLFVAFV